jgi:hypothetical protein
MMGTRDLNWWNQRMMDFNTNAKSTDKLTAAMYERTRGSLSLNCYMNLTKIMNTGNMDALSYLSNLYPIIDPANNESWYLVAVVNAKQHLNDQVFQNLNKAIQQGFRDKIRLQSEPDFQSLQSDPRFNQLLQSIK